MNKTAKKALRMGLESFKKVYTWVQNNKKSTKRGQKGWKIFKKDRKGPICVKRAKTKEGIWEESNNSEKGERKNEPKSKQE